MNGKYSQNYDDIKLEILIKIIEMTVPYEQNLNILSDKINNKKLLIIYLKSEINYILNK